MDDQQQDTAELRTQIAVLENVVKNLERAIERQALEYERRLGELNHAHAQAMERNAEFIRREVWETALRGINATMKSLSDEMNKRLGTLENWKSQVTGIYVGIGLGAGLAGGIIAALIAKLIK